MAKPRAILKRRISVENIAKITSTMEMIATAKFKKAHDRAVAARPYTDRLARLIGQLSQATGEFRHPLLERREPKHIAVVTISSNRGLCGGYNANVARQLVQFRKKTEERGLPMELHVCGKKLGGWLRYQKVETASFHTHFEDKPTFAEVDALVSPLMLRYESGDIDELWVIYTKFLSGARQEAVTEQILPLEPPEEAGSPAGDMIFHPDAKSILFDLLPRSVRLYMFQANAYEIIRDLTLLYNRSRQTQITTELSEIIGGAAALE